MVSSALLIEDSLGMVEEWMCSMVPTRGAFLAIGDDVICIIQSIKRCRLYAHELRASSFLPYCLL